MTEENAEKNKKFAFPYADISSPFAVDERGSRAEFILQDPNTMSDLVLGATILIEDYRGTQKFWSSGRVVSLKAISPFNPARENLLYIESEETSPTAVLSEVKGPHTHQPMIIGVKLDQELISNATLPKREFVSLPIQRPPSSSSRLFFPKILPDKSDPDPSLKEILNIKDKGVPFGYIGFGNIPYKQDGKMLTYYWDIDSLDNKHIFIVGESGAGKTAFLKSLAYEIRKNYPKYRILLTDLQGDITQLLLPDIVNVEDVGGWQKDTIKENPKDALAKFGKFQLIIPKSRRPQSTHLIALKKLVQKAGIPVHEIALRLQDLGAPSDVEYLYRVASPQVAMLLDEEFFALSDKKDRRIDKIEGILRAKMRGEKTYDGIIGSSGTPYLKTTFDATLRALTNLKNTFDFDQSSLTSTTAPLDCLRFDGTTILYLEHLDIEAKIMWEMQTILWLNEHKSEEWEAFAFFDEAHEIIPKRAPRGEGKETFSRLRSQFVLLAREGRKFGIHLVLSTQSPQDLHEVVPDQCPTRIVMKLNPRNAQYAYLEPELAMIASKFGKGQFWLLSPFNGTSDWVRIHSALAPLPHEAMTPFWAKVLEDAKK